MGDRERDTYIHASALLVRNVPVDDVIARIEARLARERDRMAAECTNPPCLHAQGIDLALSWVREEACRWAHEGDNGG